MKLERKQRTSPGTAGPGPRPRHHAELRATVSPRSQSWNRGKHSNTVSRVDILALIGELERDRVDVDPGGNLGQIQVPKGAGDD